LRPPPPPPDCERAAGVSAGGRTGLTAVTVGVLMLACLIFSPLVQSIPAFATAPALLYVGAQMLRSAREIDWDDMTEAAPAFLTIVFMPFTYSIADGIAFGFISYALIKLLCNRTQDVPPMVWIVAVLWALKFWFLTSPEKKDRRSKIFSGGLFYFTQRLKLSVKDYFFTFLAAGLAAAFAPLSNAQKRVTI